MNNKEMRPLSVKTSKKKSVGSTKPRSKWWVAIVLLVLFISYLVWAWNNTIVEDNSTSTTSMQSTAEQVDSTQASEPAENVANNALLVDNEDGSETTDSDMPDPNAILDAPLPETDSLAKEEIDRLKDEGLRLAEQEKSAAEQVAMNKQLTDMKAEQIELLEQQIAQLEADTLAKNTAK